MRNAPGKCGEFRNRLTRTVTLQIRSQSPRPPLTKCDRGRAGPMESHSTETRQGHIEEKMNETVKERNRYRWEATHQDVYDKCV